jgi:acetolactate synthase I/II/III large subunit
MAKSKAGSFGRRGFLKSAAAGAAVIAAKPQIAKAQDGAQATGSAPAAGAAARGPGAAQLARDAGTPAESARVIENPGSDFMVDVIKSLGIEYLAANPGSTFESLHESLINYGRNTLPEFLTCTHEEAAVAMAHGYAKIEGKPMMALIHGTVGLLHASMAVYNA